MKKRGCPLCEWNGDIAETHDRTTMYYTHVEIRDGTLVDLGQCSEPLSSA